MRIWQIVVLAVIQGLAELLPVSSSAHVIVVEKFMGLDPSSPAMVFLLVMLHTGTTAAVVVYFLPRWRARFTGDRGAARSLLLSLSAATAATGVVGFPLKHVIEKRLLAGGEIESLFASLPLIGTALGAAGVLILAADFLGRPADGGDEVSLPSALWIGAVQGLCLPFRGFSRSGATISTALLRGVSKALSEDFSFALSVILTPPLIARSGLKLVKASATIGPELFVPGLLGMVFAFFAGLLALRWLSSWLENGRWRYFGYYCLAAAAAVHVLARVGR
ncbi:MAG: undecaprenyl-diphosphate phosphatase [Elusimicrobia bacterium]|nr:undecaprenyl-diphosphate phosphatase [Elusimicrobiota bacterium]